MVSIFSTETSWLNQGRWYVYVFGGSPREYLSSSACSHWLRGYNTANSTLISCTICKLLTLRWQGHMVTHGNIALHWGYTLISRGNIADISDHMYCLISCLTGVEDAHNTLHHYWDFMCTTRIIGGRWGFRCRDTRWHPGGPCLEMCDDNRP